MIYYILPRENNSTERESMGVGRDILISKKLFILSMRTMRKHFPVSWLTSGRLAFANQSEAGSTNLKKMATIVVVISHVKKKVLPTTLNGSV